MSMLFMQHMCDLSSAWMLSTGKGGVFLAWSTVGYRSLSICSTLIAQTSSSPAADKITLVVTTLLHGRVVFGKCSCIFSCL